MVALATVPLGKGRLGRLADIRLKRWWLLVGAFALQVVALRLPDTSTAGALHAASYLTGALYLGSNLHLPGLWWVGLGGTLNFVAIAVNGGVMPADPAALAIVGGRLREGFVNSAALDDPRLAFLGDIFPVPLPGGLANVVSIGDVIICAGIFLAVHRIAGSRLVRPATGLAHGLAALPRVRTIAVAHALSWTGSWLLAASVVVMTVGRAGALASAVAMGLSGVCAALMLAGPLADRFNRTALLACATFGQACAAALLLIWPSPTLVGAVAVVVGFGTGLAQPAAFALLAEVVEPARRTPALGGLAALSTGISLLGAGLPLGLLRNSGPRPVLGASTLACGLAALAWSITPAQRRQAPRRATLWRDLLLAVRALEDTPLLARLALLAVALGGGVGLAASDPFAAVGLAWRRATPLGLSAGALATGALVGALACAAARRPASLLRIAFAVAGAGLFVGSSGGTDSWALGAWVIGGIGVGGAAVLLTSATVGSAPPHLSGRLLALVLAGQLVGLGTGYTLGGSLQRSGGEVATGAAAGIALFAAAAVAARIRDDSVPDVGINDSVSDVGINDPEELVVEGESSEVLGEESEEPVVGLPHGWVGDVRGDEAVVEIPEGVPAGEGLGIGDIEGGAAEAAGAQGVDEFVGHHMASPGDVDQEASWSESVELLSPDDLARGWGESQGHESDEGAGENFAEIPQTDGPCRTCQWLGLSAHDCCLHVERSELSEQRLGNPPGAEDGHPGAVERAGASGG